MSPIHGSLHLVLTSSDTEIVPQNLPIQIPPAFILPLLSPLLTTVKTSSNVESRPVLLAESACHLHLSTAPLVLALLANVAPIFENSE